jgi:hypothetical protein
MHIEEATMAMLHDHSGGLLRQMLAVEAAHPRAVRVYRDGHLEPEPWSDYLFRILEDTVHVYY